MHQLKRFVIFFGFFSSTCLAGIAIKGIDPLQSKVIEATVRILRSCYGNRAIPVGLAGKSAGTISKALWSQARFSVTVIDDTSRTVDSPIHPKTPYKVQVFVVSASSAETLIRILRQIKASIWWNHMAAFLIIDSSPLTDDCSNTFDMLWTAWEMNILHAKFMCYHRTEGRLIYSFNPYTGRAPDAWRFNGTYSGMKNHPWTLFVQGYEDGEEVCDELDFVKTNDLGGYEIRVSVGDSMAHERKNSEGMCFDPLASDTCSMIFPALNATLKLIKHEAADSLGRVNDKGHAFGILREITEGLSDVGMNARTMSTFTNQTTLYPIYQAEMLVATQYSDYQSQLHKICSVIDSKSRFGVILVILITILFIKYFLRPSILMALLDTVRLICNSSLPKTPERVDTKIYLVSLFSFIITMQGIFQGRLASVLTKPEPIRNVNTITDLADLDYTVYGLPTFNIFFSDPAFAGRYVPVKGDSCIRYALNDSKAACLSLGSVIMAEAAEFKLHVSSEIIGVTAVTLPIRPDWPLEQRFNALNERAASGGLRQHLTSSSLDRVRRLLVLQETAYKDEGIKVLTLQQLTFAFVLLGIGLGLASVSFISELAAEKHDWSNRISRRGNIVQAHIRRLVEQPCPYLSALRNERRQILYLRRCPGHFSGDRIFYAVKPTDLSIETT